MGRQNGSRKEGRREAAPSRHERGRNQRRRHRRSEARPRRGLQKRVPRALTEAGVAAKEMGTPDVRVEARLHTAA